MSNYTTPRDAEPARITVDSAADSMALALADWIANLAPDDIEKQREIAREIARRVPPLLLKRLNP